MERNEVTVCQLRVTHQKEATPCSAETRVKQLTMPV